MSQHRKLLGNDVVSEFTEPLQRFLAFKLLDSLIFDNVSRSVGRHHQKNPSFRGSFASGTCSVSRGSGPLAFLIGWCLGFPKPTAEREPVSLQVQQQGSVEYWERYFGAEQFITVSKLSKDGKHFEIKDPSSWLPFVLTCRLVPVDGGWRDVTIGASISMLGGWLNVPIPRCLAPSADTVTRGTADGWEFDIQVKAPMVGLVLRYQGTIDHVV